MHRQAAIAVLAAAVLVPALQAQMRGGGGTARGVARAPAVAPGRGGFAAARGPMAGGHIPMAGRRMPPGTGTLTPLGHKGFYPNHHNRFIFTSGCYYGYCANYGYPYYGYYGYGYGYPAYYYPPIFSGFDYSDYGNYAAAAAPAAQAAPAYNDTGLAVQIQHLTDEVEQLRDQQQAAYPPPPPAAQPRPSRMEQPTILVFRDGRVKEVKNYGIVGKTLWLFDEQHAKRVPLEELDIPATQAANEDRGGFVVPKGSF